MSQRHQEIRLYMSTKSVVLTLGCHFSEKCVKAHELMSSNLTIAAFIRGAEVSAYKCLFPRRAYVGTISPSEQCQSLKCYQIT